MSRIYNVNDNFFEKQNPINSYYAGFIAADGNIDSEYQYRLSISLSAKDRDFLQRFLDNLESNYNIYELESHGFPTVAIAISSKKICNDLKDNFNIVPKKSLISTPPIFNNKEMEDCFIMGLIDGDGTIGYSKHSGRDALYISCVGTEQQMNLIKNRFEEILNKNISNLFFRDPNKNFCSIRISDKNAREIFKYFYEKYNYLPLLNRKWTEENYQYCLSYKKNLPISRRKGVNIFNLTGKLIKQCDTLKEASEFTGASQGRISDMCKMNDNFHQAKGFMFSRDKLEMPPYEASKNVNKKYIEDNA